MQSHLCCISCPDSIVFRNRSFSAPPLLTRFRPISLHALAFSDLPKCFCLSTITNRIQQQARDVNKCNSCHYFVKCYLEVMNHRAGDRCIVCRAFLQDFSEYTNILGRISLEKFMTFESAETVYV
jgi:hypothetical protein